ncbi:hypothetical protein IQ241_08450 [Romeria aff. gracilis LEGE 07310]|uniref:Uncharacterized protein n=1 Tax=Vasconcelosia minhoensis LEGE 07310 TaxID=915328 RepID=A0A8J7ACY7_9CYAN|nr:hypothetical protein [Romeria gracilis]MBE9077324.1 hypothetical protein [Romeria aff. gracilis LEGE 07310]
MAEDPEELSAGEAAQKVIEWFERNQVEEENYYEPDPQVDALLDGLSLYLGDNYSILKKFHWKLRNSVGKRVHFSLEGYDSRAKRIHNQYLKSSGRATIYRSEDLSKKQRAQIISWLLPIGVQIYRGFSMGAGLSGSLRIKSLICLIRLGLATSILEIQKLYMQTKSRQSWICFFCWMENHC